MASDPSATLPAEHKYWQEILPLCDARHLRLAFIIYRLNRAHSGMQQEGLMLNSYLNTQRSQHPFPLPSRGPHLMNPDIDPGKSQMVKMCKQTAGDGVTSIEYYEQDTVHMRHKLQQ